jgi:hypothetical protein
MKTVLGIEAGSRSCVAEADFNPRYIKTNVFIVSLKSQIKILSCLSFIMRLIMHVL